jgi:hypothetical protein
MLYDSALFRFSSDSLNKKYVKGTRGQCRTRASLTLKRRRTQGRRQTLCVHHNSNVHASTARGTDDSVSRFSSLPPEILSLIRLWLHVLENDEAYETPEIDLLYFLHRVVLNRSFPLVCRRFREAELSIPELWSTVATNTTFERAKLHIARSGDPVARANQSVSILGDFGRRKRFLPVRPLGVACQSCSTM